MGRKGEREEEVVSKGVNKCEERSEYRVQCAVGLCGCVC